MKIGKILLMAALLPAATVAYGQAISTLAALPNLKTAQNSIYLTDPGKEGLFILSSATGLKVDSATVIQDGANKLYTRYITGPINAGWWLKPGAADNSDAMDKVLAFATSGSEIIIPPGIYQFSRPILLLENKALTIKSKGRLVFRNSDGLIIRGRQVVEIEAIEGQPWSEAPDYPNMTYSGITLEDASFSEVTVHSAASFLNGIRLTATGQQSPNQRLGTQYNRITFNALQHNRVGVLLMTGKVSNAPNVIDGDKPWVNENTITGGGIWGETGIATTKGAYQTDPFNGNKFYNIGFENLSYAANLNFAGNNMFIAPRFEAHAPFTVAPDCRANIIFTSEIYRERLAGTGHETLIIGQILKTGGVQEAVMEATDLDGNLRAIVRNVPAP